MIGCPKAVPAIGERSVLQHANTVTDKNVVDGVAGLEFLECTERRVAAEVAIRTRVSSVRHPHLCAAGLQRPVRRTIFLNIQVTGQNERSRSDDLFDLFQYQSPALSSSFFSSMIEV